MPAYEISISILRNKSVIGILRYGNKLKGAISEKWSLHPTTLRTCVNADSDHCNLHRLYSIIVFLLKVKVDFLLTAGNIHQPDKLEFNNIN